MTRRIRAIVLALCVGMSVGGIGALSTDRAQASPLGTAFGQVQVVNVSPTSFAVVWVTGDATPGQGEVRYGTSPSSLAAVASEKTPVIPGSRGDVHLVQVINLQTQTTYYFDVGSTSDNTWDANNGQHYSALTAKTPESLPAPRLLQGTVLRSDGSGAAGDALVVQVVDRNGSDDPGTSQSLAIQTSSSGQFGLSLNPFRQDGSDYFIFSNGDGVAYTVIGGADGQATGEAKLQSGLVLSIRLSPGTLLPASTPTAGSTGTAGTVPTVTATSQLTVASATPVPSSTPLPTATVVLATAIAGQADVSPTRVPTDVPIALPTPLPPTPTAIAPQSALRPAVTQAPAVAQGPAAAPGPTAPSGSVISPTGGRPLPPATTYPIPPAAPAGGIPIQQASPSPNRPALSKPTVTPPIVPTGTPGTPAPVTVVGGSSLASGGPPGPIGSVLGLGAVLIVVGFSLALVGVVRQWRRGS